MSKNFMHKILPALLFSLCAVLLMACGDAVQMTPLSSDATILAFGDSLTAGNGASEEGSYPAQLSLLLNRLVINAGISGEESSEGKTRVAALLDTHRPQLLILCHGGNDLLRKRPVSELEGNLMEMIAMARARGIEVLLLGVPAPGVFLSSEAVYETVAEATGVAFIADVVADVLKRPAMKSDAIHPNAAGYGEMASEIFSELQNLGAI
ncbi:MAG: arylesterase [Gammaproteobacteria bacterium]|nr:arylesterase [Gammaproteobacteria bacterium]